MAILPNYDIMRLIRRWIISQGVTYANGFRNHIYISRLYDKPYINIKQVNRRMTNHYQTKDFRLVVNWLEQINRYKITELDDKIDDLISRLTKPCKFKLGNLQDIDPTKDDKDVYLSYFIVDDILSGVVNYENLKNGLMWIHFEFTTQRLYYEAPDFIR